jgi:hypothetical protein
MMWISTNITNIYLASIKFRTLQHLCNTLYKSHRIPTVLEILPYLRLEPVVYSQCAVHIVVGPCAKGHFIHAGPFSGPGVLLLLLRTSDGQVVVKDIQSAAPKKFRPYTYP